MDFTKISVSLDQLLLDPNNFRFLDLPDHIGVLPDAFHLPEVQAEVLTLLAKKESFGLSALQHSILTNGWVPVERIVVARYNSAYSRSSKDLYVVIEGNRRTAALKNIDRQHRSGTLSIDEPLQKVLRNIEVLCMEGTTEEIEDERLVIMGIRHVSGVKEWGGYQQAKLVGHLRDCCHMDFVTISRKLGLGRTTQKVYRSLKAFEQMKADDEFGSLVQPNFYTLLSEAVGNPTIRTWLGWSESTWSFEDESNLRSLYELITPTDDSTGKPRKKITNDQQIRALKRIIPKPAALAALLDPDKSFDEALSLASPPREVKWNIAVDRCSSALAKIPATQLAALTPHEIESLEALQASIQTTLKMVSALQK